MDAVAAEEGGAGHFFAVLVHIKIERERECSADFLAKLCWSIDSRTRDT